MQKQFAIPFEWESPIWDAPQKIQIPCQTTSDPKIFASSYSRILLSSQSILPVGSKITLIDSFLFSGMWSLENWQANENWFYDWSDTKVNEVKFKIVKLSNWYGIQNALGWVLPNGGMGHGNVKETKDFIIFICNLANSSNLKREHWY